MTKYVKDFNCSYSGLESLKDHPALYEKINGSFRCDGNNLKNLDGCPKLVTGNFYCQHNKLTSLKGIQKEIFGNLDCSGNNLTDLESLPKLIKGTLYLVNNKELKNPKDQIIKNQIKAEKYIINDEEFEFKDIKEEFEKYNRFLLKEQKNIIRNKLTKNPKYNNDYGFSL